MARFLEIKEFEGRKKALLAEGDVYRQMMRLELQNARLYAFTMQRRCRSFGTGNPLLLFGIPLLNNYLKRRVSRKFGFLGKVFSSWQMISRGLALVSNFLNSRRRPFPAAAPSRTKY